MSFSDNISEIREKFSTADSSETPTPPEAPCYSHFKHVSEEIHKDIPKSPTKSCMLDPRPTVLGDRMFRHSSISNKIGKLLLV